MRVSTSRRAQLAGWLIVALLFMQFATIVYACPRAALDASSAMPVDCAEMAGLDAEQPQLCKAHCEQDRQALNSAPSLPDAGTFVGPVSWLAPVCEPVTPRPTDRAALDTGPPRGAPPVYLAFVVLRN